MPTNFYFKVLLEWNPLECGRPNVLFECVQDENVYNIYL